MYEWTSSSTAPTYIVAIVFKMVYVGLWCLTSRSTIFQLVVYRGDHFLLVEETEVPEENHRHVASQWQTSLHNIISSTPRHERDSSSQYLVAIDTDCIGCCKSSYHTITTTTVPFNKWRISFIFSLVSIQHFFS